ncbi:hypothetical protein [Legionella waltersii]|uniref:Glycosyltransferase RgtA/B/C/D-like domain-containing protein n=1 Tax=Legionella waltersii TaxID=66969 RepID=A0A0W1AN71_9GAMM|nr:hypothetical protein [Legionella waltersii]KTD82764.1 hypothetical protein Lwal_0242 [Legionella waltersii]SNV01170.1 Uncharacterised protein [Legionella waltersii]
MDLLKVVLIYCEFVGLGLILRRYIAVPLYLSPPIIVSIIVILIYFLGFIFSIKSIAIFLHLIGLASFIWVSVPQLKQVLLNKDVGYINKTFMSYFLSGLIILLVFFLLDHKGEFVSWDEFSHWGSVIRTFYEAGSYNVNPNPLYCQDYPPGTALFSYYVLLLLGYTEGHAFFSFSLLLLCYVTPLVIFASRIKVLLGVFISIVLLYLGFALGNGWASVLIDHVLSFGLAGIIIFYYLSHGKFNHLIFIPFMLGALVLFKHVGMNLALFAAVICSLDLIIFKFGTKNNSLSPPKEIFNSVKYFCWFLLLFGFPLLTNLSWKYFVQYNNLISTWGNLSLGLFFKNSLSCCSTPREIEVAGKFFATFFDLGKPYSEPLSIMNYSKDAIARVNWMHLLFHSPNYNVAKVIISLGFWGILGASLFQTSLKTTRYILLNLEFLFCTLLYSGSLLLAYLYGFSDYEAKILTSFQRYHNVFLLAWSIILLYVYAELMNESASKTKQWIVTIIVLGISVWSLYSATPYVKSYVKHGAWPASVQRNEVRNVIEHLNLKTKIPLKAKVYIAWYGSNGWEFWMTKYELLPRMTNVFCFSLGPKLNPDDMYTCQFETKLIRNYDYLFIGKGLQVLKQNYSPYFDNVPDNVDEGLLKIEKRANNISLEYIQQ